MDEFRRTKRTSAKKYARQLAETVNALVPEIGYTMSQEDRAAMPLPVRGCMAKVKFRSRAAAMKWVKTHPPCAERGQLKVKPYQCPRCWEWHLTSNC